jgi:hypothetical protein
VPFLHEERYYAEHHHALAEFPSLSKKMKKLGTLYKVFRSDVRKTPLPGMLIRFYPEKRGASLWNRFLLAARLTYKL